MKFPKTNKTQVGKYGTIKTEPMEKEITDEIYYTTAEESYDGFGTKTIEKTSYTDDRGRQVRKVSIPKKTIDWQTLRYSSGNRPAFTEAEFELYKGTIFQTKTMEKEKFTVVDKTTPLETQAIQNPQIQDSTYIPASETCAPLETIVPQSMRYDMFKAIETVDRRVNGVDEYVAEKLGYVVGKCTIDQKKEGLKCLCDAFAAEQVDAIAVAIYNIEEKNQGCIIGDQTGIGKGRQAAAIIRYAVARGLKPIFLTEKPNLFSDIFRDLIAIGSDDAIPMEILEGTKQIEKKASKATLEEGEEEDGSINEEEQELTEYVTVPVYKKNPGYPNTYTFVLVDQDGNEKIQTRTRKKSMRPFIVNGAGSKTAIKDEDGNIIYKGLVGPENKKIIESGIVPKDFDFVLATYSQFRGATDSPKMQFLLNHAAGNVVIMDESHNASGSSNVGAFLRNVLKNTLGVTFLSATFAKRPDNMPIYAGKTSMADANMDSDALVAAITSGGVALQEIVSAGLVAEGQMIRRQRSFEGIEVNYEYLDPSQELRGYPNFNLEQQHKAVMDNATEIIREIMAFQRDYVNPEIQRLDKIAKSEYAQVEKRKGTSGAGVDNQPIFSGVFNIINQLLFAIKAESVANVAIDRMKQGKKAVIAFANTMESFIDTLTGDDGKLVGDGDIVSSDFSKIFEKRLNGVMRYTVKDAKGNSEVQTLDPHEMSPEFRVEHKRLLTKIKKASLGISSSPIDVLIYHIQKAGFNLAEVTGRSKQLKMLDGGRAQIKTRTKISANDAFRKFNNNEVDCLLINQSGSTGASAHAIPTSKVPKDKVKQRVMVILQAELNVNTEVQKRGRINRTGQVLKPIYDYVISAIPAEKRLMMMLQKKLKSLDANTSSSQKESEDLLDAKQIDFLNKYGDQIVVDYLKEHPLINLQIGDPLGIDGTKPEDVINTENAAHRVSGRVAILSTKDQENFYSEISQRYVAALEYLKQTGEYDLEVENMNLQAETIEKEIIVVGKGGDSVFGRNSILEKVSVLNLKKPYNQNELQNIIKESLGEYDAQTLKQNLIKKYETFVDFKQKEEITEQEDHYNNLLSKIETERGISKIEDATERREAISARKDTINDAKDEAIERTNNYWKNKKDQITKILAFFHIGKVVAYPSVTYASDGQYHKGVFLGFVIPENSKNPYAPSALKLRFAIASSQRYIAVPASKYEIIDAVRSLTYANIFSDEQEYVVNNWDEVIKEKTKDRSIRYIVTGNILQAFGNQALRGNLISYTTITGGVKKGILLPETFTKERRGDKEAIKITVPIIKALPLIKGMRDGNSMLTNDGVSIIRYHDSYKIAVNASAKVGGKFYLDKIIMGLTTQGLFNKIGSQMVAHIEERKIENFIQYLQDNFNSSVNIAQTAFDFIKDGIEDKDYGDEEKRPEEEVIINKLTEGDQAEAARRQKEEADKQFEAEQKAAADELAKKAADEAEGESFALDKRKAAIKKKLVNIIRILNNQTILMRRGGTVKVDAGFEQAKKTAYEMGVKAHSEGRMAAPAVNREFMQFVFESDFQMHDERIALMKEYARAYYDENHKEVVKKFPEMYAKK